MQLTIMQSNMDPSETCTLDPNTQKEFRFGDDRTDNSTGVMSMDTSLVGCPVNYNQHVMNGGAPMLASVMFLRDIDEYVGFKAGIGYSPKLDPHHVYELKRMTSGHLGLALHDPGSRHRRYHIEKNEVFDILKKAEEAFAAVDKRGANEA